MDLFEFFLLSWVNPLECIFYCFSGGGIFSYYITVVEIEVETHYYFVIWADILLFLFNLFNGDIYTVYNAVSLYPFLLLLRLILLEKCFLKWLN